MTRTESELVIALFDVLGFEERVRTFSLEQVHSQYKELLAIANTKGSHAFFDARPAGDGTFVPYFGHITVDHDYFSDTILLWTRLSAGTLGPFLHLCCSFVCETLKSELPIRGALTVGSAIMDKSTRTYLGQPLVEAARVEKAQEWIGVSFGPSFADRRDIPHNPELVRMYTKHRKPGYSDLVPGLVVDWPRAWRKENNDSAVPLLDRLSRRSKVPEYYKRTIEFVNYSDENPNWFRSARPGPSSRARKALMPATVFGHPLRNPLWGPLSLRQKLVRELNEFLFVHPPAWANLLAFWHNSRMYSIATLALADCPDGLNFCFNLSTLSNVAPVLGSLVSCSSLMTTRLMDDDVESSVIVVPIPMDFASFEDDAETLAVSPPPILNRIAQFELTIDTTQTSRGPAAIAIGRITISQSWIDWMEAEGLALQRSARCFSATFMPPTIVEATFLKNGLFFHKSTGMTPTFLGEIPWELGGTVGLFDVQISFVPGCSASNLASISEWNFANFDDRARSLRALVDQAAELVVGGLHEGPERERWNDLRRNWEDEQRRDARELLNRLIRFGGVGHTTELGDVMLRLYVCTKCPAPGLWTADTGRLGKEMSDFAADQASQALREGPFITASLL